MRSGILLLFSITLISLVIYSCDSGGSSSAERAPESGEIILPPLGQAKSENQFGINPALQVDADRDTYVTFLESSDTTEELNITGELGNDEFPYVYEEAINHTICWEGQNQESRHLMILSDSFGAEVLRVEANGDCVTQLIPAGIYIVSVEHDNLSSEIFPVFFVPELVQAASVNNSFSGKLFSTLKAILNNIDLTELSYAQTGSIQITTTIRTGECRGCNLQEILLRGQDLSGTDLESANLDSAILEFSEFDNTNLMSASLMGADLRGTNFTGSDIRGADLNFSEIDECTTFLDADLTGAIWVDGCTCSNSICSNCDDIPMMPAPEGLIGGSDCLTVPGPGEGGPIILTN